MYPYGTYLVHRALHLSAGEQRLSDERMGRLAKDIDDLTTRLRRWLRSFLPSRWLASSTEAPPATSVLRSQGLESFPTLYCRRRARCQAKSEGTSRQCKPRVQKVSWSALEEA